jgi:N-methylhydantoinase A/oxoprolinase/acetone carboxylase beta subunit
LLFLGFDTGGTYTDAVIFDPGKSQVIAAAKSLTTKQDLSIGLRKAMELVLPAATGPITLVSLSTTPCRSGAGSRHRPRCLHCRRAQRHRR